MSTCFASADFPNLFPVERRPSTGLVWRAENPPDPGRHSGCQRHPGDLLVGAPGPFASGTYAFTGSVSCLLDKSVVLGMAAYPKPNHRVLLHDSYRPVAVSHPGGPICAGNFLESEGGMMGIQPPETVLFDSY